MKRLPLLALAALPLLLAVRARAQYDVANNSDSGASGSLRYELGNAPSGQTITWVAGSGGTIALGSALPTAQGNTLDVSAAGSAVTIENYSIPLSGAVTFTNTSANAWTISSAVTDSSSLGSLYKSGSGELILTGANTYSGGTFIEGGVLNVNGDAALGNSAAALTFTGSGGTLQAGAALSSARNIALNANGTFDTNGFASSLSGAINGAGQLTVTGSGSLSLSGSNSYTGGTLVQGGATLGINGAGALGTSGVTLNGGTLQTQASLTDTHDYALGAGGGTIDTDGSDSTFSGNFTGAGGSLTKIGLGVLTLSGSGNTYTGGTTVAGGTLQYGVDNALPASGAVTINSGATLDMNGFDQTNTLGLVTNNGGLFNVGVSQVAMNNGYSGTGTLAIKVQAGVTNVSSTGANLNFSGTKLSAALAPGILPTNGQTFTSVVTGISNDFAGIISPAALEFVPSYAGGALTLTVHFIPFASIAATPNQAAVAAALEPLRAGPSGDIASVMESLYSLNAPALQSAFDQIGPIPLATMGGLGRTESDVNDAAVSRRVSELADGPTRGPADTMATGDEWSEFSDIYNSWRSEPSTGTAVQEAEAGSGWSAWGSVVDNDGRFDGAGSGGGYQPGYDFDVIGLHFGGDRRLTDSLAAGVAASFLHGHASIDSGLGTVDDDNGRVGGYIVAGNDDARADAYVGGAVHAYDTVRDVNFGAVSRSATADPFGTELNLAAHGSFDLRSQTWGTFSPFLGLNYDRLNINGFSESGADSLDLSVQPETAPSLRSTMGLRFSEKARTGMGSYEAFFQAGWRHEFLDPSYDIAAQLAGEGGTFSVATTNADRDGAVFGGGLALVVTPQATLDLDYSGDLRPYYIANLFNIGLHYRF